MIKRLEPAAPPDDDGDGRTEAFAPPKELRKLLREVPGVQMWQVEDLQPGPGRRPPVIRYEVTSAGAVRVFGRPHEAWEYFRALAKLPDARSASARRRLF